MLIEFTFQVVSNAEKAKFSIERALHMSVGCAAIEWLRDRIFLAVELCL